MLGISFRIFCGLCDSEVDFRSLGGRFGRLGVAFGGAFWVSWAAAGGPGAPFRNHFGDLGVLWGSILGVRKCIRAPSTEKNPLPFQVPSFLAYFGAQRVPKGLPKWS